MEALEQHASDAPFIDLSARSDAPRLMYRDARGATVELGLEGRTETRIGRDASCDIVLHDQRISRRHAFISLVDSQHLLRDMGSSNGTFLNGFRIAPDHAFALRHGDVVEIGNARFTYSVERRGPTPAPEANCSAFSPRDLVRDGYFDLDLNERTELHGNIHRAFEGVSPPVGLERCMDVVATLLEVSVAAFFVVKSKGELRPMAAAPRQGAAGALTRLAEQTWASHEAKLVSRPASADQAPSMETYVGGELSMAAVPLTCGKLGAVAVVQRAGRRLDRSDAALLAVLGTSIMLTLSLQGGANGDTRIGLVD